MTPARGGRVATLHTEGMSTPLAGLGLGIPVIAGICFGSLVYKPQMAVLIPFALAAGAPAAGDRWRAFAAAAVTAVVLVLASLALFGTATWA